jgi:Sulfotransferase family
VHQPLLLVSQIHRSGGTLLTRLLDGHPQLHVVPHELGPLLPRRALPLDPEEAWSLLSDPKLRGYFTKGLKQPESRLPGQAGRLPLLLPPGLHRLLFERALGSGAATERDVLDAYLTGYFNAWLDYAGLRGDKRFVVGFEPEGLLRSETLRRVDDLYPEGRIVSIIRDPWSWYVSARRWDRRFAAIGPALHDWSASVRAALELKAARPDRVRLLGFDGLVRATEAAMRDLADWLGISFDPVLLEPTLNRMTVASNSSFPTDTTGVSSEPAGRRRVLEPDEERLVETSAGALYEEALRHVDSGAKAVA